MNNEKETESKFGIFREELGMSLHTALRKACDSNPTSLAWNLIQLDSMAHAWGEYLDIVWSKIKEVKKQPGNFGPILEASAEALEYGKHARACLKITFRFFDKNDWSGMAAYLAD